MRKLACGLALALVPAAAAAPAPAPSAVRAEVVFRLPDAATLQAVTTRLRSTVESLQQAGVQLGTLRTVTDQRRSAEALGAAGSPRGPATWLACRLEMAANREEGTLTLRLVGCPRKAAVPMLEEVLRAYRAGAEVDRANEEMRRVMLLRRQRLLLRQQALLAVRGVVVDIDVKEAGPVVPSITVVKPPRLVFGR